ncbi:unnamed protein product [Pleuronectes platessa]|uniref:Uncharacterized protein n=1 Tax=Pleuronectes platessa TaxID=8262 RepID=A0A9N7YLY8_PLEPL|nr:unnamed protein product [Pleuronectes platessa]
MVVRGEGGRSACKLTSRICRPLDVPSQPQKDTGQSFCPLRLIDEITVVRCSTAWGPPSHSGRGTNPPRGTGNQRATTHTPTQTLTPHALTHSPLHSSVSYTSKERKGGVWWRGDDCTAEALMRSQSHVGPDQRFLPQPVTYLSSLILLTTTQSASSPRSGLFCTVRAF